MAHRGASAYAPENTLEAFALAIEMGAHGIELDIYETSDGKLVIHHDNNIKRMSGVDARITETDLATLRSYNFAGEYGEKYSFVKIPEFREVLELFKPTDMVINIEMKEGSDNYIRAIDALVREYGMEEQVIYSSFDHFQIAKMKEIVVVIKAPGGTDNRLYGSVTAKDISDALKAAHGIDIDKRKISLADTIKAYGNYQADVKLYTEVTGKITVRVEK